MIAFIRGFLDARKEVRRLMAEREERERLFRKLELDFKAAKGRLKKQRDRT
jgi:hypothetical protein